MLEPELGSIMQREGLVPEFTRVLCPPLIYTTSQNCPLFKSVLQKQSRLGYSFVIGDSCLISSYYIAILEVTLIQKIDIKLYFYFKGDLRTRGADFVYMLSIHVIFERTGIGKGFFPLNLNRAPS